MFSILPRLASEWPYVAHLLCALADKWKYKAAVTLSGGVAYSVVRDLMGMYTKLLDTDPSLVLLAITMFVADLLTAMYRIATTEETFDPSRLRDAGKKFILYVTVVAVCVMLANGFQRVPWPGIEHIAVFDLAALLWVAVTEGTSATKNVGADLGIWRRIKAITQGEIFKVKP